MKILLFWIVLGVIVLFGNTSLEPAWYDCYKYPCKIMEAGNYQYWLVAPGGTVRMVETHLDPCESATTPRQAL